MVLTWCSRSECQPVVPVVGRIHNGRAFGSSLLVLVILSAFVQHFIDVVWPYVIWLDEVQRGGAQMVFGGFCLDVYPRFSILVII